MSIWKRDFTLESLNRSSAGTLIEHLGICYSRIGDDFLQATMGVEPMTRQPMGLLHGGASVVLAETLGSVAANHVRAKRDGVVTGTARPLHLGATTQLWQIDIHDEKAHLVCTSRLTLAIRQSKRG